MGKTCTTKSPIKGLGGACMVGLAVTGVVGYTVTGRVLAIFRRGCLLHPRPCISQKICLEVV